MRHANAFLVAASCAVLAACSSNNPFVLDGAVFEAGATGVDTGTPRDVINTTDTGVVPDAGADVAVVDVTTSDATDAASDTSAPDAVVLADARDASAVDVIDASATDVAVADAIASDTAVTADVVDTGTTVDVVDASATDTGATVDVVDASVTDASDAAADVVVVVDAGPPALPRATPTLDGFIGTDWPSNAVRADNTIATMWGATLNEMRSIRLAYDDTNLYFAIDGEVESQNAIVLYLDVDDGASTGATTASALNDHSGALDTALSYPYGSFPGNGFGVDWAWGTLGMQSRSGGLIVDTRDDVGLRAIAGRSTDYAYLPGDTTVCNGVNRVCEVALAWSVLYAGSRPANAHLALFVRLVRADGTAISTQTLPQDDGLEHADRVSQVLRVTVP